MAISLNYKADINNTYIGEMKEYLRLFDLGSARTSTGTINFTSSSSTLVYNSTTGENGILAALKIVIDTYQIDAQDWNNLIGEVSYEASTIGRINSYRGFRRSSVASGGVNTGNKTFTLNPFSVDSYIDIDVDPFNIQSWKDLICNVNLTSNNSAFYLIYKADRATPIIAQTALINGLNVIDIRTLVNASTDPIIVVRLKITRLATTDPTATISDFSIGWVANKHADTTDFNNANISLISSPATVQSAIDIVGSKFAGTPFYLTPSGTNTYVASTGTIPYTSYLTGTTVICNFGNSNTSSATLNLNSLGVKNIKKYSNFTKINLAGDELKNSVLMYDGTDFVLIAGDATVGTSIWIWTVAGAYPWMCPQTGVYRTVCVGGGGQGGGKTGGDNGGGGGGSGYVQRTSQTLTRGQLYYANVGKGGSTPSNTGAGQNGGNSSIAGSNANGGQGGGDGTGSRVGGNGSAGGGGGGHTGGSFGAGGSGIGGSGGSGSGTNGGGGGGYSAAASGVNGGAGLNTIGTITDFSGTGTAGIRGGSGSYPYNGGAGGGGYGGVGVRADYGGGGGGGYGADGYGQGGAGGGGGSAGSSAFGANGSDGLLVIYKDWNPGGTFT